MKRMLLCLCFIFLGFFCLAQPQYNQENKDTTVLEKKVEQWIDSLNTRKFSEDTKKLKEDIERLKEDAEILKEDIKEFSDKTKKSIERHTPKVKKLIKEIEDYLKR